MRVPPEAAELEGHMRMRRQATALLVDCEGFERWGSKDDPAQNARMEQAARDGGRMRAESNAALEARVPEIRASCPAAIEAWVAAHQQLLDELLARADLDRTSHSVATEEKAEWDRVLRGEIDCFSANPVYVHYDRALYEALFGFEP